MAYVTRSILARTRPLGKSACTATRSSGERFGYEVNGEKYVLWSSGPDRRSDTPDDLNWRPGEGITRGR